MATIDCPSWIDVLVRSRMIASDVSWDEIVTMGEASFHFNLMVVY
jgi:hypothetical protein